MILLILFIYIGIPIIMIKIFKMIIPILIKEIKFIKEDMKNQEKYREMKKKILENQYNKIIEEEKKQE